MKFCMDTRELFDTKNKRIHLRQQALEVLWVLAANRNNTVSKDLLFNHVWKGKIVTEDSLSQCVVAIRKALNDDKHELIKTVPKRGYRLDYPHEKLTIIHKRNSELIKTATAGSGSVPAVANFTQTHDGLDLAYARNGAGPALIRAPHWMTHVLHEWNDNVFGPRYRRLAQELEMIRYDGRGFGLSDRSVGCGTFKDWVEDMHSIVLATNLDKLGLIGNSGGAPLSMVYSATYPERIGCLVLMGGFVEGSLKRGVKASHVQAFINLIEDGWAGRNAAFRQIMSTQLFPGATSEQMNEFDELQRKSTDGKTAAKLISILSELDVQNYLPRIKAPTLILHSKHDARQPFEQAVKMSKLIPNSELHVLETINHTPLQHEPAFESSSRLVIDFVTKHCG